MSLWCRRLSWKSKCLPLACCNIAKNIRERKRVRSCAKWHLKGIHGDPRDKGDDHSFQVQGDGKSGKYCRHGCVYRDENGDQERKKERKPELELEYAGLFLEGVDFSRPFNFILFQTIIILLKEDCIELEQKGTHPRIHSLHIIIYEGGGEGIEGRRREGHEDGY